MQPAPTTEIELLYRQHGSALLLFATAITGERSRAQDAVHQVFLRLIESGTLRNASDPKAYLFACVRNATLNDSAARRRHVELDDDSAWFAPPDRDYAAESNLRRALLALPEEQRHVTVLFSVGRIDVCAHSQDFGNQSQYRSIAIPLCLSQVTGSDECQGGCLCQSTKMTNSRVT